MTLEAISVAAAVGTFVVIAATAIAAIVQLRHLRASNHLQGLLAVLSMPYEPALDESFAFVSHGLPDKLRDPNFRRELAAPGPKDRHIHKELRVCDYYERLGSMLKYRLFPEELYFDNSTPELAWKRLEPVIALQRRTRGPVVYDNFEYLVARSREWDARHPNGNYPSHTKRLVLEDVWLAEDRRSGGANDESAGLEGDVGR